MKALFILLATFVFTAANTFAADYLLIIEGIKGETIYSGPIKSTITVSVPEQGALGKVKVKNPQGIEIMSYSFGASNSGGRTSSFSWGVSNPSSTSSIQSPRDPASGQATGKRQHSPIVLTKELDKSSPLLAVAEASAMSSNNPTITIDVNGSTLKVTCNQAMVATYDLKAAKK